MFGLRMGMQSYHGFGDSVNADRPDRHCTRRGRSLSSAGFAVALSPKRERPGATRAPSNPLAR
jgi:hypothetical protein